MKSYLLMAALFSVAFNAAAQGIIYECAGSGKPESSKSVTRCTKIESPNTSKAAAVAVTNTARPISTSSSPIDFPRVNQATQKARDSDRKQILLDELQSEDRKMNALLREYNNGVPERRADEKNLATYQERTAALKDEVMRTGKNVDALKRELAKVN